MPASALMVYHFLQMTSRILDETGRARPGPRRLYMGGQSKRIEAAAVTPRRGGAYAGAENWRPPLRCGVANKTAADDPVNYWVLPHGR